MKKAKRIIRNFLLELLVLSFFGWLIWKGSMEPLSGPIHTILTCIGAFVVVVAALVFIALLASD